MDIWERELVEAACKNVASNMGLEIVENYWPEVRYADMVFYSDIYRLRLINPQVKGDYGRTIEWRKNILKGTETVFISQTDMIRYDLNEMIAKELYRLRKEREGRWSKWMEQRFLEVH